MPCHYYWASLNTTNSLRNQLLLSPLIRLVLENDDKCRKHALLAYYLAFEIRDTPQSAPFDVCYVALLHIITLLQHYFGLSEERNKRIEIRAIRTF